MEINIGAGAVTSNLFRTAMIYGPSRAGKTRFCGTFPRPAFFTALREGGYTTVQYMPKSAFYEPDRVPKIYALRNEREFREHFNKDVLPKIQRREVQTIVLELSIFTDDVIATSPSGANGWEKYGNLEKLIMHFDMLWKATPGLRVIYNALSAEESNTENTSTILTAGKALGRKLPALCDTIGFMRRITDQNGNVEHLLHFAPHGNFIAGHRYGDLLPNVIRNPSFRLLEQIVSGAVRLDSHGAVVASSSAALPALGGLPSLDGPPPLGGLPPLS